MPAGRRQAGPRRGEISTIVVTQLIQSLLLAGLIMLMFTRLVTVHVQRIAIHLGRLVPSNLGHALVLNRKKLHRDELTLLVTGVNQLQGSLAELVLDRTAELEALSAAQHVVLTLSNRLIHAPLAEFDRYNFECLRDIAQRLNASDALWYVLDPGGTEYRVFLEWHANATPVPQAGALSVDGWSRLLAVLAQDDLLTFPSQAALADAITTGEAAPFATMGWKPLHLPCCRGSTSSLDFWFLANGWPRPIDDRMNGHCWR